MSNCLADETSPYLQQHAENPVEWFPWGPEALDKARLENKPILLSVGYSACHWCHVMAHESFEDAETAKVMNELFINIKVDREERPDLDKIYQLAHQVITQRPGGWPLTMFLTPQECIPFFGGTYFPKEQKFNLPGFKDLMRRVADFYQNSPQDIARNNQSLMDSLSETFSQSLAERSEAGLLNSNKLLDYFTQQMEQNYDSANGGFGRAPKFPHSTSIECLLRIRRHSKAFENKDNQVEEMALFTLKKMAQGGMNDQIGGGFCRYSVDDLWMIPHFEKMLYDNGPLMSVYCHAGFVTGNDYFRDVVRMTANWVIREMQSDDGGYFSSLDADSEGEEGKFYVWTREEIRGLLGEQDYQFIKRYFGFDRKANFEGKWNPHIYEDTKILTKQLSKIKEVLYDYRAKRVWPGRDEKILTSWNGLMIRGMALAGRYLEDEGLTHSAEKALEFVRSTLWANGRLLATYKDGKAHLIGYLDDYAFLMDAILELLQNRWRTEDLNFSVQLANVLLNHFQDESYGGFYFTADDHEPLIQRPKSWSDDSMPAGNGVAVSALMRLGHLLGETRYIDTAENALRAAVGSIEQSPVSHAAMLSALDDYQRPPSLVILRGEYDRMREWQAHVQAAYGFNALCYCIPSDEENLPAMLARKTPLGEITAYICEGQTCREAITDLEGFISAIAE